MTLEITNSNTLLETTQQSQPLIVDVGYNDIRSVQIAVESDAIRAENAATTAENARDAAQSAETNSEAFALDAADSAASALASANAAGAKIYATEAAGIAGVAIGEIFYVPLSPSGGLDIRQKTGAGTSVSIGQFLPPTQSAADGTAGRLVRVQDGDVRYGRVFATRAGLVSAVSAGFVAASGLVYMAGGVEYIGATGATAITDLPGLLPHGLVTPKHFGAVGDGTTPDTAAFASIPMGTEVDLQDCVYVVSTIPTHISAFNGTWKVGSTLTYATARPLTHPLDGTPIAVKAGVAGTIHPGPIFYLENDAQVVSIYAQAVSHAPHAGMVVMARYSDDDGLTSSKQISIYQSDTQIVRAMIGGAWGDGYALILSLTDGTTRSHALITLAADGTWSAPAALSGITEDLVAYGKVHRWPAAAGGHDTNGYIFYAYNTSTTPKKAVSIRTADAGTTWVQSSIYEGVGDEIPTEIDLGQVPGQAQWIGYLRFSGSSSNPREWFKAFKTTNMTSATFYDTTLESGGSENKVGQPPFVLVDGGRFYLYTPFREDWTSTDQYEQGLYYYEAVASDLWANNGVFPNPVPRLACMIPSRALGMMAAVNTPRGWICQMRGAETEYPESSTQPVNSQLILLSRSPKVVLAGQVAGDAAPRENKIDNPIFGFAESGTLFSGVTANGADVIERWQAWPSGGTMDFERVALPAAATRAIPARPIYGMKITSSVSDADMGFQQVHYGFNKLMEFSDKVVTATIWGYGTPGNFAGLRAIAVVNTGSPEYSVSDAFAVPVNTGGLWYTTARLFIGNLSGLTPGSNDRIAFRFGNANALPWDVTICAIKLEIGDYATPIETPDPAHEESKCRAYYERIGGGGRLIGSTFRDGATATKCLVNFDRKIKVPSVTFEGSISDLTFDSVSSALTGVSFTSSGRIGRTSAELTFAHDSTTGPGAGHLSSANNTAIVVRC